MANNSAEEIYYVEGLPCVKANLIELLIREVRNTPVLWDRFDNDYNVRAVTDAAWAKIAKVLGKNKDFLKNKWRNLRDQFLREHKKVKVPYDNPTKPYIEYYRGKWLYFEKMLFLRKSLPTNVVTVAEYDSPEEAEVHGETVVKEEIIEFEDNPLIPNVLFNVDHCSYTTATVPIETLGISHNDNTFIIKPNDEIVEKIKNEENPLEPNSRKRKCSDSSESVVSAKNKRPSANGNSSSDDQDHQDDIDDDLHFVKSLVPFLRKLTPIRKLLVRNEIHNLLIKETLCDKCKQNNTHTC